MKKIGILLFLTLTLTLTTGCSTKINSKDISNEKQPVNNSIKTVDKENKQVEFTTNKAAQSIIKVYKIENCKLEKTFSNDSQENFKCGDIGIIVWKELKKYNGKKAYSATTASIEMKERGGSGTIDKILYITEDENVYNEAGEKL